MTSSGVKDLRGELRPSVTAELCLHDPVRKTNEEARGETSRKEENRYRGKKDRRSRCVNHMHPQIITYSQIGKEGELVKRVFPGREKANWE